MMIRRRGTSIFFIILVSKTIQTSSAMLLDLKDDVTCRKFSDITLDLISFTSGLTTAILIICERQ